MESEPESTAVKTIVLDFIVGSDPFRIYLAFEEAIEIPRKPDVIFLAMDRGNAYPVQEIQVEYKNG